MSLTILPLAVQGIKIEKDGPLVFSSEGFAIPEGEKTRLHIFIEEGEPYNLNISVGRNAFLELFLESRLSKERRCTTKLVLEDSAKVKLKEIHHNTGMLKTEHDFSCGENSSLEREVINFSFGKIVLNLKCALVGENASFSDAEVHFGSQKGETENKIEVLHEASETKSVIKVKSALKDASRNFTIGNVVVKKATMNADTFFSAHALLLDKDASASAIPSLEIESADVQAGHAASVTNIDEDSLFYLMSRGLSFEDARKEMVRGFLQDLLDDKKISELIEEQWQQNLMLSV